MVFFIIRDFTNYVYKLVHFEWIILNLYGIDSQPFLCSQFVSTFESTQRLQFECDKSNRRCSISDKDIKDKQDKRRLWERKKKQATRSLHFINDIIFFHLKLQFLRGWRHDDTDELYHLNCVIWNPFSHRHNVYPKPYLLVYRRYNLKLAIPIFSFKITLRFGGLILSISPTGIYRI